MNLNKLIDHCYFIIHAQCSTQVLNPVQWSCHGRVLGGFPLIVRFFQLALISNHVNQELSSDHTSQFFKNISTLIFNKILGLGEHPFENKSHYNRDNIVGGLTLAAKNECKIVCLFKVAKKLPYVVPYAMYYAKIFRTKSRM